MSDRKIHNAIEEHYLKWQAKCRSVVRCRDTADDLLHHCLELLYSKPAEYIVKAIDNGTINALMNRLMYSELFFDRGSFNLTRKNGVTHIDIKEVLNLPCNDEGFRRYMYRDMLEVIEREEGWYRLKVMELVEVDGWSMVELSKRSGIPRASLADAKKKLTDACKKKHDGI